MDQTNLMLFLFNALWQAALFGLSAVALIKLLKITKASVRAALWSAAFFLSAIVPFTSLTLVEAVNATPAARTAAAALEAAAVAGPALGAQAHTIPLSGTMITLGGFLAPVMWVFLAIWTAGALWRFAGLVRDSLQIAQLRWESTPVDKTEVQVAIPNAVSLRSHPEIAIPVATGLFRPAIILPEDAARDLQSAQAKSMIAHELAHIHRGDLLAVFTESIVLSVFWWNPALRKMRAAIIENREMACDDRAVASIKDAGAYARTLLGCAEEAVRRRRGESYRTALAATGKSSDLHRRITRLTADDYAQALHVSSARIISAGTAIMAVFLCAATAAPRVAIAIANEDARAVFDQEPARDSAELLGRQLVRAITERDWRGADALIEAGADVNAVLYGDGTPLIAAVNAGSTAYVRKLISLGANVDAEAAYDETALISAVRQENEDMVRLLIEAGADVNKSSTTENGVVRSPLAEAQRLNLGGIEKMLRDAGAR